ncbi:serine/threonine-protein kinase [Embleya sp. NPDC055664]
MEPDTVLSGRYRLYARLGSGGMGEVWSALDQYLNRPVAVKIVLADPNVDPALTARLRQEARTAAALQHPCITVVHDIGVHGHRPYFVMELLTGHDFTALLADHPAGLPVDFALRLMIPAAAALAHAHRHGVVHRDIKPAKFVLTTGGAVKVCDFGIARYAEAATRLTTVGGVVGTPAYMAPEQWRGEQVGAHTDLYAFGATLHTLLAGRPPFPGPTDAALMYQHLDHAPLRLRALRPDAPHELDDLIRNLLAKPPTARPATAGHVEAALRSTLDRVVTAGGPIAAPVPGRGNTPETTRPRVVASDGPTTIVNGRWTIVGNAALHGGMYALVVAAVFAMIEGLSGEPDGSDTVFGVLLVTVLGAFLGVCLGFGYSTVPDVVTLDGAGLTVTRTVPSRTGPQRIPFSVRWDAVDHITVDIDENGKSVLIAHFLPSRHPTPQWTTRHGVSKRADGGHVVYGPVGNRLMMIDPERLRTALPRHAGRLYRDRDDIPDP